MQPLKKIFINGFMVLNLSLGLTISVMAADDIERLKSLAEQGDVDAQSALGSRYNLGKNGVSKDYTKANYWYAKAANQGDAVSQYLLGYSYLNGEGIRQDYGKAIYWLKKASDQNLPQAQYELGRIYYQGLGVRQNKSQAKEWYGKTCDNGGQYGCDEYRRLNEQGQ